MHIDTRTSENFTEEGLHTNTGQSSGDWGRYVLKELLDNALEATSGDASVSVEVVADVVGGTSKVARKFTVRDDGVGISDDRLEEVFGRPEVFGGTKRHYALPTRGNQGNALMTILGIQHVVGGPLVIESRGVRYHLEASEKPLEGAYDVDIQPVGACETEGFGVTVDFDTSAKLYTSLNDIRRTAHTFAVLNPQASIRYAQRSDDEDLQENVTYPPIEDGTVESMSLASKATTGKATWFAFEEFKERFIADAQVAPSLTIREFVSEFSGLSSRAKVDEVLNGLDWGDSELRTFFDDDDIDKDAVVELYARMRDHTSTYSPGGTASTIGSVGDDLLDRTCEAAEVFTRGVEIEDAAEFGVYYSTGGVFEPDSTIEKIVPFSIEVATIPYKLKCDATYHDSTKTVFGINQSVAYTEPRFDDVIEIGRKGSRTMRIDGVSEAFRDFDHRFVVVCNLTCPNIDFQDKGKQTFDTEPFLDAFGELLGKTVRKIERDVQPELNRRCENPDPTPDRTLSGKAPQDFAKRFVREHFDEVYEERTTGGKYSIRMRQLYYPMRDLFFEWCDANGYEHHPDAKVEEPNEPELTLNYNTFTTNVKAYEEDVLGERVVRRHKRGTFTEPHSNQQVELGTAGVNQYTPTLDEYGSLLFVEKTGFSEQIHNEFELTKRYDIGLVCTRGMSTIACRDLIEKVQAKSEEKITLYTLTDFDIKGLGIASNALEADELSTVDEFDSELLGIRLEDVEEYDLSAEPVSYKKGTRTELKNKYDRGEVSEAVYDYLMANGGQRVEVNALPPLELKQYLETRFEELGIEKIEPEVEDVDTLDETDVDEETDDGIGRGVTHYLDDTQSELVAALRDHESVPDGEDLRDEIEEAGIPIGDDSAEGFHDQIIEELAEHPPKLWSDINEEIVDEHRADLDSIIDAHKRNITDAVEVLLNEHVTVSVEMSDELRD